MKSIKKSDYILFKYLNKSEFIPFKARNNAIIINNYLDRI